MGKSIQRNRQEIGDRIMDGFVRLNIKTFIKIKNKNLILYNLSLKYQQLSVALYFEWDFLGFICKTGRQADLKAKL